MASYAVPVLESPTPVAAGEVLLIASGDLRQSANKVCWAAQSEVEKQLTEALRAEGFRLRRAHPYRDDLEQGFIYNQRMGMDVFMKIHPDAPVIIAEAVWQYSNHVLSGLEHHRGPILTVANWSGQWPRLVGNHLNVADAPTSQIADPALAAKAAMMADLGIRVHLCGD
jgi:hypothetical protein